MDSFFSIKGKDSIIISGILGIFIYFLLMDGNEDQDRFYYIFLGSGAWFIIKNIYWRIRTLRITKLSQYDLDRCYKEIDKIKKYDENRAEIILNILFNK